MVLYLKDVAKWVRLEEYTLQGWNKTRELSWFSWLSNGNWNDFATLSKWAKDAIGCAICDCSVSVDILSRTDSGKDDSTPMMIDVQLWATPILKTLWWKFRVGRSQISLKMTFLVRIFIKRGAPPTIPEVQLSFPQWHSCFRMPMYLAL